MQTLDLVTTTLGAAVGSGATFTMPYPAGRSADDYLGSSGHTIISNGMRNLNSASNEFSVSFGAANISVTLTAAVAFPIGSVLYVYLDRGEDPLDADLASADRMSKMTTVRLLLGSPLTASANAAVLTQACTLLTGLATGINGALATAGVAVFSVPRNVVAAWTGTAILTIEGTDEFGNVMRESSASGTSFVGKKAFKTIKKVTTSADITALTVGNGVVLGLPVFLADVPDVIREAQDGAVAAAGTIVAGDNTAATATTGDVRGTYSPSVAPNGARVYELTAMVRARSYRGRAQF